MVNEPAPSPDVAPGPPGEVAKSDGTGQLATLPLGARIVESIQTVLTALMLAFMFRAFFVEAFIIPTGSMAQSLLGQHGVLLCTTCGWEVDYGPGVVRADRPNEFIPPKQAFCPNCHAFIPVPEGRATYRAGDRILVHKWLYILGGPLRPDRWDVIVFRDPGNSTQNYIKRVVGLPGETIEIIDGDVYIQPPHADGFHIARKTPAAQESLWFVVFDQSYLPTDPARSHQPPAWVPANPDRAPDVGWSGLDTRVIRHDAHDGIPREIVFAPIGSRYYLQDVYGYNHGGAGHYVGDARILAEVTATTGSGWLRWELVRDGQSFVAQLDSNGRLRLSTIPAGAGSVETTLATAEVSPLVDGRPHVAEFGHLDYRVYVRLDGREVLASTPAQYAPQVDDLRNSRRIAPLELRIAAKDLTLTMRGLRVDRDVHYVQTANTLRGQAGNPFTLGDGEYFVLGDNSPDSVDSREWFHVGLHLQASLQCGAYRLGTVRADQIVGKAFFVYLPGLLPIDGADRWRIPDLGRMRFIR